MKRIMVIGMIGVFTLISVGCGCEKKNKKETKNEEKTVVNTSKEVIKDQQVEVFKMTNTSLVYENGMSTLVTEVTNTSNEEQHIKTFDIIVKDKSGGEMITLLGYIGEDIPAGITRTITSNTDMDLSEAGSIEYKINR